jgi:hypothetical protein
MSLALIGHLGGAATKGVGRRPCHSDRWVPPARGWLPESSRLFFLYTWLFSLYVNLTCGPPLVLFLITPYRNRHSPKLVKFY